MQFLWCCFCAGEVFLYNIFYEIFTVCTSIIAQAPDGQSLMKVVIVKSKIEKQNA